MNKRAAPGTISSAFRVFDLSLGEMLWSRRTIFMGLVVGVPVVLAAIIRLFTALGAPSWRINRIAIDRYPLLDVGHSLCQRFARGISASPLRKVSSVDRAPVRSLDAGLDGALCPAHVLADLPALAPIVRGLELGFE